MTSTTGGDKAPSFGWLGREAIASGTYQPHMNVFGGEDRFWLGPEGGQYALYFKPGDPFDLPHWQTPAPFDWEPWDIADQSAGHVRFHKRMSLVNYAGTPFDIDVERTVRLLRGRRDQRARRRAGRRPARRLRVRQHRDQRRRAAVDAGVADCVSIWILGQFLPTPETTIAIPFAPGPNRRWDRSSTMPTSGRSRAIG